MSDDDLDIESIRAMLRAAKIEASAPVPSGTSVITPGEISVPWGSPNLGRFLRLSLVITEKLLGEVSHLEAKAKSREPKPYWVAYGPDVCRRDLVPGFGMDVPTDYPSALSIIVSRIAAPAFGYQRYLRVHLGRWSLHHGGAVVAEGESSDNLLGMDAAEAKARELGWLVEAP
jgi:hypothetical protein